MAIVEFIPNQIQSSSDQFFDEKEFRSIVEKGLALAKKLGASSAAVGIAGGTGFNVDVRLGEVEKVEHQQTRQFGITLYVGHKKAGCSTNDFSSQSIATAVEKAYQMAKYTSEDPCAALPDPKMLGFDYQNPDLDYPWDIEVKQAIDLAKACEATALSLDKLITNSEGASVATGRVLQVLGNSYGFLGSYITTNHSLSCSLIAGKGDAMQRDGDYSLTRDARDLWSPEIVARKAVAKTVRRLNAKKIATLKCPVIFESQVARTLVGSFLKAINGYNLYRKSSFLLDKVGCKVFADHVSIQEKPHLAKAWGSAPFDGEGVKTNERFLVIDGILQGYLLDSYAARKLKMQTTGNSGGAHNVFISHGDQNLESLLKMMDKGFLVTELLGSGANIMTGDYSRAAFGFWVENGVIQYPVMGVTIASNLKDIFSNIVAIGNDVDYRSSIYTGSILVESMTVAG
ncbi:MAG: hypothetical protein A2X78_01090 [Gammaproteobacteria bacterium GWE2_37_16]|nr:MAG: hypothetical protein A2X78_01090 [Gammaproteobacteria bacterium GWE2_37_16]